MYCANTLIETLDISGCPYLVSAVTEGTRSESGDAVGYSYYDSSTYSYWILSVPNSTVVLTERSLFFDEERSRAIFELVNQQRAENGVAPLNYCEALQEAADLRAVECSELFSHTRPDGSKCYTAFNVPYLAAAENIAMRSSAIASPEQFVNAWMNSEGHRRNILNPTYTEMAVGIYVAPGTGAVYATQLFILPR